MKRDAMMFGFGMLVAGVLAGCAAVQPTLRTAFDALGPMIKETLLELFEQEVGSGAVPDILSDRMGCVPPRTEREADFFAAMHNHDEPQPGLYASCYLPVKP